MPYYIGDVIKDKNRLVALTPEEFKKTGVDVILGNGVEAIDAEKGQVKLSDGAILPYDILVMGTGADAILPEMAGQDLPGVYTLRNLTDGLRIKSYLNEKVIRKAAIVGAGFIAMEMSEALRNLGIETVVLSRSPLPVARWDAAFSKMIVEELHKNQVTFLPGTKPVAIEKGKDFALRMTTNCGEMDADLILMALGIKRNVKLAEAIGLKTGESGAIQVNFAQRTSCEEIYAVGDCCEVFNRVSQKWMYLPLGDIANKQGRIAGQNIGGSPGIFPGVVGAQSFKVFNLEVAATGLTEAEALKSGFHPVSNIIWGLPIARSMAKDEKLGIKLIADKPSGKLLGAQSISAGEGAVKRINMLSVALWAGMDLTDISYLDLAYSPTFGGAWDPIHIAAQGLMRKMA